MLKKGFPSLIFFLFFTIVPLGAGLFYALLYSLGLVGAMNSGFTLLHWQRVLSDGSFWFSLLTSASVAAVSLSISLVFAMFFCIFIHKKNIHHSSSAIYHFYLPLSMPPIIAAFLTFQFLGNSGMVSRIFYHIGLIQNIENFPELVSDKWYIGVIVTQVLMTFPFLTLLFLSFYKKLNISQLSQLSKTLGATESQTQSRVVIPILLQNAQPNLLLFFIFLMSSYEIPLLLGRQSPMMLSVLISQKFRKFDLADIPQAYVMTVIYAIVVMFLVVFIIKKQRKG